GDGPVFARAVHGQIWRFAQAVLRDDCRERTTQGRTMRIEMEGLPMLTRRQFVLRSSSAFLTLASAARAAHAADRETLPDGSAAKDMITPAAQQAIDQGLAFLSKCQHFDGSFGTGPYNGNVAIASLASLAMMAGGHQPDRGIYGSVVSKALRYVLDQNNGGYLVS